MRNLFMISLMIVLLVATVAIAEKQVYESTPRQMVPCGLNTITYDWDFSQGDMGFTAMICEDGGVPAWEHGTTTYIPGAPGTVWGTVLGAAYNNNTGDGLISPSFYVDVGTELVEVYHYFDIETNYDGGNLVVNGTVVPPMGGYNGTISTSTSFYAYCTDLEEGFTGHDATWRVDCFDLNPFIGTNVQLEFDFGSDSSVTYPGWYIAWIKVGTYVVPTEEQSWGHIKGLYR
jgi:hypothetical protein